MDWQQPMGGPPQAPGPAGAKPRPFLKIAIALILLAALGWVLLLIAQYCQTGNRISDLPGVGPIAGLFDRPSFEYVGSINGLQNPMGVAVGQDGRVYVTETGGERMIHVYNSLREEVGSFAPPDTQAPGRVPVYVAVSPKGDVYVSDRGASAIFIFSPDGVPQGRVTPPEGFEDWHPLGLTFDEAGNLYVADVTPGKHRVLVLNRVLILNPTPASTVGIDPVLVHALPEGSILKLSFGSQGEEDGQFWFPNGIAVDSQGRIYVADSNNGRMQAFDKDGKFLFKISRGMSPSDLSIPRGIAVDSENRLLIVDTSRGAVQAYGISESAGSDSESAPLQFLGAFSGSTGAGVFFQFPNGLALDGHGQIYIADRANDRVQIWKY
ncbi:MAG: NHL repeat-containing protein [Dehalococcoidia bacterium]|nr:NHL repeat-containing protein [Dehalococcoidia bacterium]